MKKIIISITFLFISSQVFAQSYLIQVRPDNSFLWGYANEKGEMVIPNKFPNSYPFSKEGVAMVFDKDAVPEYYLIDTQGKKITTEVTGCKYNATVFSDGFIPFGIDGKWGYLNKTGKIAVQAKYTEARSFSEGRAIVKRNQKYYILDTLLQETEININPKSDIYKFSGGLALYREYTSKTMGFFGTDGQVKIKPEYLSAGFFKNGITWVKNTEHLIGYINEKGEEVIKPKFSAVAEFDETGSVTRVRIKFKWFLMKRNGDLTPAPDSDNKGDFENGLALAKGINTLYGYIGTDGEWAIKPQFKSVRDFKKWLRGC